jgi:hypothetical protein
MGGKRNSEVGYVHKNIYRNLTGVGREGFIKKPKYLLRAFSRK